MSIIPPIKKKKKTKKKIKHPSGEWLALFSPVFFWAEPSLGPGSPGLQLPCSQTCRTRRLNAFGGKRLAFRDQQGGLS